MANTPLWSLQQHLKDRTSRENDPGVVYRLKCGNCEQGDIGETGRTACVCVKEHASYVKNGRFDMSAAAEHAIFEQHAWISTSWKLSIANVTVWSGESRKHSTSTRRSTLWTETKDWNWNKSGSASSPNTLCSVSKGITYLVSQLPTKYLLLL